MVYVKQNFPARLVKLRKFLYGISGRVGGKKQMMHFMRGSTVFPKLVDGQLHRGCAWQGALLEAAETFHLWETVLFLESS